MSDREFLLRFEACAIPRVEWTHASHVRMAWIYLRTVPQSQALSRIREGIQRLNASYGNKTGYHETVTRAFVHLISVAISSDDPILGTITEFRHKHPELFSKQRPVLLNYYSKEALASRRAIARFLAPDLKPLPPIVIKLALRGLHDGSLGANHDLSGQVARRVRSR